MRPPPPKHLHQGYTLVELLIVVAVLMTVLSLAVPSLRKLSERGQLQDAARQLRGQLLAARLQAIESASSKFFYYQPGSGIFMVTADHAAGPVQAPGDLYVGQEVPAAPAMGERRGADSTEQVLPSDVRFLVPGTAAARPSSAGSQFIDPGGGWSEPLIFFPNGRALNTRIRVASDRYWVEVTVRGLTGTVQLSPVQRLAESPDRASEASP